MDERVVDGVSRRDTICIMHPIRTRAIGYVRVSTDKQADRGVSLDAQREKIRSYAALYDLEIVEYVVDAGASASTLERPGLERALAALRNRCVDAIVVVKLDRLTRSVRDLGELVDRYFADGRSALLSVSEQVDTRTAAGRLVLNVLGSVSQWERESVSERPAMAMRYKAAAGEFTGGEPPYGYRRGSDGLHLAREPREQEVIAHARRLRARGLSLRAIAARLLRRGMRSRAGRPFAHPQIGRMIALREWELEMSSETVPASGKTSS